ncbi:MAG: hypothetical protein U5L95_05155 [Candidatus Saccharibacteria bacterium]|nr:hypothetical protein [Candidatus Saccharibacteria bacterium]
MLDFSKFQELLERDMTRKEFLQYLGMGLLGIVGVSSIANNLQKSGFVHRQTSEKPAAGYGMSAYGR